MNHTVTADPNRVCECTYEGRAIHPQQGLAVPDHKPLYTYLFCRRCGGVRNRIMPFVFKMQRAQP